MIQSITFGDKNTYDDWQLVAIERPVFSPPTVNKTMIGVPGGNGFLDLSEALTGYPTYSHRSGEFRFRALNDVPRNWSDRYSEIMEYLHGKSIKAILFDDPDWYYEGRFTVTGWEPANNWSEIGIQYEAQPFKWNVQTSTDRWLWDPFNFITGIIWEKELVNVEINSPSTWITNTYNRNIFGYAPIIPVMIVSGAINLQMRLINPFLKIDKTVTLSNGTNEIEGFILYGGPTYSFLFRGVGTITFSFRIGRL